MAVPEISVDTSTFDRLILQVATDSTGPIVGDVVTDSTAAEKYWPVLEHGSRPGGRPWPHPRKKTVLSGGRVYSRQAPGGFVGKRRSLFLRYLKDAFLAAVRAKRGPLNREELAAAVNDALGLAKEQISSAAPVDSGQFHDSIDIKPAK